MFKSEFLAQQKRINDQHGKDIAELYSKYVEANCEYRVGDIVKNNVIAMKVSKVAYAAPYTLCNNTGFPIAILKGKRVNKRTLRPVKVTEHITMSTDSVIFLKRDENEGDANE